jgi:hypothetical protein
MLPTVDFCGLKLTRLLIGANPFGGFSHQTKERDAAMVAYNTPERIKETWARAEAAGINTMVTNNETPHVVNTVRDYLSHGGRLQWIAQISAKSVPAYCEAVDKAVDIGAKAFYYHGGVADEIYGRRDEKMLRECVKHARKHKVPIGVAGHSPDTHFWVDSLGLVDFHVVCFFNCGSLHSGKGHKFKLADAFAATDCIRRLQKPCIGYKIMAAGRIDPAMAFEYAYQNIKPNDVVNVGMHRGDKDGMVEENVAIVQKLLVG